MCHFVAAPFCTRLLADLGADVIKVERRAGDPVRQWGEQIDGRSLWWSMHGRNKRSIALDLKSAKGREIVLGLVAKCDVVVENFRSEEHTSELQSLMRISYAVFCLKKKNTTHTHNQQNITKKT